MEKKKKCINAMKWILYIYVFLLSVVLLFKGNYTPSMILNRVQSVKWNREMGNWNYNLVLFKTISSEFQRGDYWMIRNIAGNVIPFCILGILLPVNIEKIRKYFRTIAICAVYVVIIELLQFVCMIGIFDIDDIFLNLLGCSVGYLLYKAWVIMRS